MLFYSFTTRPNVPPSRLGPHPSMRESRSNRTPILLPREIDDCWKLSYVLGGGGASSQACSILCMAGTAWDGGQDRLSARP